jgi:hypothetical protein
MLGCLHRFAGNVRRWDMHTEKLSAEVKTCLKTIDHTGWGTAMESLALRYIRCAVGVTLVVETLQSQP